MTVLVTGGCGFIGTNFIKRWLNTKDEQLINIDKLTYAANRETSRIKDRNYRFFQTDINEIDTVRGILNHFSPRIIFHFAAESHVDRSIHSSSEFIKTNINGTHALLAASLQYFSGLGADAKSQFKFINISTDEVYGSLLINDDGFTEDSPLAPNSPYSASKASSDLLARAFYKTHSLPVIITRCSNNFGPFQHKEKFIPTIISAALENKKIPIYGAGCQIRDWLFVEDHVEALLQVAKKASPGELFNVGGGTELENIKLAQIICRQLEVKLKKPPGCYEKLIMFVEDRAGHDFRYSINPKLIEDRLGWSTKTVFTQAIENTLEYYISIGPN